MTEYALFTTRDLIEFASNRDNGTPLERELADRLSQAYEMLDEQAPGSRLAEAMHPAQVQ